MQTERGVIVRHLRGSQAAAGTYIGLDFLATDANGQPIPCDSADLTVDVEVAFADAPQQFVPVRDGTVLVRCVNDRSANIGMVLDNSGSQASVIDLTKVGAKSFASEIMADGGAISLTRVSTDSRVLSDLSTDTAQVQQELDGMFVNGGWTALYDGIRLGNETLGASLDASAGQVTYTDVDDFCDASKRYGVVAFTNGFENNSAQQKLVTSRDDGIDTQLDDLKQLSVDSVGTPLYIIGLGDDVNDAELQDLSDSTGGRYPTSPASRISPRPTASSPTTRAPPRRCAWRSVAEAAGRRRCVCLTAMRPRRARSKVSKTTQSTFPVSRRHSRAAW